MSTLVHEYSADVTSPDGKAFVVRAMGDDEDGHWHGWLEFTPRRAGLSLRTDRETSQVTFEQLEYWASGLSPDYLEMAFQRARPVERRSGRIRATRG
jgi:hypothetical protein